MCGVWGKIDVVCNLNEMTVNAPECCNIIGFRCVVWEMFHFCF